MHSSYVDINQLATYLNEYLDSSTFEDSALNGIQVGNKGNISHIATAVSASLETIEKAAAIGANALIVHHGIFLKKEMQGITGTHYKKIKKLIESDIALLCYHLPLDAHTAVGNNWKAAHDLGLQNLQPFAQFGKKFIGVKGSISKTPFNEFQNKIEHYYGQKANVVKIHEYISSVAIVSGAGEKCILDAARAGLDCLITGRVDEPVWDHAHEENVSFFGLGHYATEIIGPKTLAEHLQKTLGVKTTFIKTSNPF